MPIAYTITIDYDSDGITDLPDNITPDVLKLEWRLGLSQPFAAVADVAQARITVNNRTGRYSPERESLLPGTPLSIHSADGTTTRTHFTGNVHHVEPDAGEWGAQASVIVAYGRMAALAAQKITLAQQQQQSADAIIGAVLATVQMRRPVLDGFCIIDYPAHNVIDNVNIFPADYPPRNFDAGLSTFAYVGDAWDDGISAQAAIRQCAASEGGRFFFNRAGEAIFYNRHRAVLQNTPQASFSDDMQGVRYAYGAALSNDLEVTIRPREIGAANTRLWALDSAVRLERESTIRLVARLRDANDNPLGALQITAPQAGIHYNANSLADASGNDETTAITIALMQRDASAAVLEVRNLTQRRVYLTALALYGTPLYMRDPLTISARDDLSITRYGLRRQRFDWPLLTDITEAQSALIYEQQRRSTPRGTLQSLTLDARFHEQAALTLTLFDLVTITESQTGHTGRYLVIAEDHTLDRAGARHHVTYTLEPAPADQFIVVDASDIDSAHVLLPR